MRPAQRSSENDEQQTREATQHDVARLAGVNRATVSRALDPERRHLLTDETVSRVLAAAEDLRYRPHSLAQGLRRQRSSVVRLSIPGAMVEQSPDFITGVEETLRRAGLSALVSLDTEDGVGRGTRGLADGTIVVAGENGPDLRELDGPVVRVGLAPGAALDVTIDHRAGISIAVGHLVRLGHTRLALVCEPENTSTGARHRRSFLAAIKEYGIAETASMLPFQPRRPVSAVEACFTLLNRHDRPTAILLTDDAAAAGCYGAARQSGLQVPDDASIVGYGAATMGMFVSPPLTTISVPARAAGRDAAEHLLALLAGEQLAPKTLTPHLIQRGSTAPPRPS